MGVSSAVLPRVTAKSNAELTAALRSNIKAARELAAVNDGKIDDGQPDKTNTTYQSWTTLSSNDLYIPKLIPTPLSEDRSAYDITVKLFYLPNVPSSARCSHTRDALSFVLKTLAISSVDLLIVSFPGITFDADDESSEEEEATPSATPRTASPTRSSSQDMDDVLRTWCTLESLHDTGVVSKLGLSEFGTQRLSRVLKNARVRPSVDQINVRDCCVVPKPLIIFARQEKIELLTHNDCTDILPPGTLRELLGPEKEGGKGGGASILASKGGDEEGIEGLKGDVRPLWVIKYTAVVKNRGVVENKGYFACAEL
jgi:glutamate--cysteine ligase regulatory subunit